MPRIFDEKPKAGILNVRDETQSDNRNLNISKRFVMIDSLS